MEKFSLGLWSRAAISQGTLRWDMGLGLKSHKTCHIITQLVFECKYDMVAFTGIGNSTVCYQYKACSL